MTASKLKIKGITRKEVVNEVEIEIYDYELKNVIWQAIVKKYPSFENIERIRPDGMIMVYDFTHPHNNEDYYKEYRLATDWEIEIWNAFNKIKEFIS